MSQLKEYWLDNPRNVSRIFYALWIACVLLIAVDLFLHRHEQFNFATLFGFHAFYGFFACVALVLIARQLRRLLMRDENYYDR